MIQVVVIKPAGGEMMIRKYTQEIDNSNALDSNH